MNKEPLIGFREALKKSFELSLQNENLGYYVKVLLFTSILYSVLIGIIAVPLFFMSAKNSIDRVNRFQTISDQYQIQQKAEMDRIQRMSDPDFDFDTMDDSYLQRGRPLSITDMEEPEEASMSPGLLALMGIFGFVFGIVAGMIQYNISMLAPLNVFKNQLTSFKDLLGKSLGKIFSMLILLFIYFVTVTIGFILFILPGIYFAVRFSFAPFILFDENKGALDSLKTSWNLIKGYTLSVYLKMVGFVLISFLVMIPLMPFLVIGIYSGLATVFLYVYQLIFMLFSIVIYFDLKRIKGNPEETGGKTTYGPAPSTENSPNSPGIPFNNQNPYSPGGIA
ncbi:hypothetical protein C4561_04525 [candidate division WWE3 bacterium]|jgi:hypothetical protein|uniref:Glycerophosphoryl diester phosphodiesterase membrane domain-containing protein n=1 Tax=candidate division WWE3 bacterium TaxID=2053526 RepID=A0A3A4ZCY2_UNCKA|nr:MAG: hypothetical protein C4561_04525 [candidate division WWE3 bacterium]